MDCLSAESGFSVARAVFRFQRGQTDRHAADYTTHVSAASAARVTTAWIGGVCLRSLGRVSFLSTHHRK